MIQVDLAVPFRPDGAERSRNWAFLEPRWQQLGWNLLLADSDAEFPFNAAVARNAAAAQGSAKVIFCADADILVSPKQARAAARQASSAGSYVVAFTWFHYLNEQSTVEVIAGTEASPELADESVVEIWPTTFALPRTVWERYGGYDERFRGWGCQDIAFYQCCKTFVATERIAGDGYHLHHPRRFPDQESNPDWTHNSSLYKRYVEASGNRVAMTELVEERCG